MGSRGSRFFKKYNIYHKGLMIWRNFCLTFIIYLCIHCSYKSISHFGFLGFLGFLGTVKKTNGADSFFHRNIVISFFHRNIWVLRGTEPWYPIQNWPKIVTQTALARISIIVDIFVPGFSSFQRHKGHIGLVAICIFSKKKIDYP